MNEDPPMRQRSDLKSVKQRLGESGAYLFMAAPDGLGTTNAFTPMKTREMPDQGFTTERAASHPDVTAIFDSIKALPALDPAPFIVTHGAIEHGKVLQLKAAGIMLIHPTTLDIFSRILAEDRRRAEPILPVEKLSPPNGIPVYTASDLANPDHVAHSRYMAALEKMMEVIPDRSLYSPKL